MVRANAGVRFLMCICFIASFWTMSGAQNELRTKLETCIIAYTDGEYQKAADSLNALIPQLSVPEDQIEAYKYLGFAYGMLNLIEQSKLTFKTALNKFGAMSIDTLEVPPNITIIFNQAKLEKKLEAISKEKQNKPIATTSVYKKNIVAPVLLLTGSLICAGGSGILLLYANDQNQKYKSVNSPDQTQLDKYYNNYQTSLIAGIACAAASAVMLPISIYLFSKKEAPSKNFSFGINGNGQWALSYAF